MTADYCFLHLRGQGNNTDQLQSALVPAMSRWRSGGMVPWGIWRGLFGVASNEQLLMVAAAEERALEDFSGVLDPSLQILRATTFAPTVRPQDSRPCDRPGVYVFRFFNIQATDVSEFVELSTEAWVSFESADSYTAEPKGLFRELSDREDLDMLLVTWYDSLQSWQTSRQFPTEARERFIRRQQLTLSTVASATVLAPLPGS